MSVDSCLAVKKNKKLYNINDQAFCLSNGSFRSGVVSNVHFISEGWSNAINFLFFRYEKSSKQNLLSTSHFFYFSILYLKLWLENFSPFGFITVPLVS